MRLLPILALLALFACRDNPPVAYPTAPPTPETEAALGSGDVLELVIFYGTHETKATYRLGPSGSLSGPFIGRVDASGKSLGDVQEEIRAALADGHLVNPIVSLTLVEGNSRNVSVFGQVQRAGVIKFVPGMTIVDAVAAELAVTPMARKNLVQITRSEAGVKKTYTVAVELIGQGRRPNFVMADGDVVFVPERIF